MKTTDIAKFSHNKLVSALQSSKRTVARLKEQSSEIGERMAEVGTNLAVGAGYSYMKGRYPLQMNAFLPGTQIEIAPVVAGLVTVAGIGGFAGKWSEFAAIAGSAALGSEINLRAYSAGIIHAQKALATAAQNAANAPTA